jgi:hypothetical protein
MLGLMDDPTLITAVTKLSSFGIRAGLTTDKMIQILEAGFTVEDLVRLIDSRFPSENRRDQYLDT